MAPKMSLYRRRNDCTIDLHEQRNASTNKKRYSIHTDTVPLKREEDGGKKRTHKETKREKTKQTNKKQTVYNKQTSI